MALYLCQNFVSAQYLENKLTEFHQILYMCNQGFVGAARLCAKWGIKLAQATLIPLARSYFPLNCEQADRQIFGFSVKSGLIIGHGNTSPFSVYFLIYYDFLAFQLSINSSTNILFSTVIIISSPQYNVLFKFFLY